MDRSTTTYAHAIVQSKDRKTGKLTIGQAAAERHVLYLGEINDEQQISWRRGVEIFEEGERFARTLELVAAERQIEQDRRSPAATNGMAVGWPANFIDS